MRPLADSHSHSKLSHDGHESALKLATRAEELGLKYYAITEHLDRDYKYCKKERFIRSLNLHKVDRTIRKIREHFAFSSIYVAYGVEAGYSHITEEWYARELPKHDFDVIINSIHTMDGGDAYFGKFYQGKTQDEVYNRYLELLSDSVRAPYDYDIIGHIGYITRYVDYPNYSLWQPQYYDKIDAVLKEIIARGKTIEINTHIRHREMRFLPERPILERYYELGGRRVTFSSDAHHAEDIAHNYELAVGVLKEIGFTSLTVYKHRQPFEIAIE